MNIKLDGITQTGYKLSPASETSAVKRSQLLFKSLFFIWKAKKNDADYWRCKGLGSFGFQSPWNKYG